MAEPTSRELKLIQYLNEAYGKEKQLETTLQAQIRLAEKTLKKRLQDHLKETKARFVNRQKGSGTRAWFDRLLAEAALTSRDIAGYESEEFTHGAVGAVVASGGADAGMGVRAAAEPLGLAFLPLGRETYFLAVRTRSAALGDLIAKLRDAAAATPGYAVP